LLALRCKRRDLAAWEELVASWNERLRYFVRRMVEHEHDAANVLQEVWLSAFRNIVTLRQDARLAPWLYTIARRAVMNHYRGRYRQDEAVATDEEFVESETDRDARIDFDNAELVHFGLGQLRMAEREILTLYFLEDLSVAEIGDVLEIPPGTVKSRLWKARQELRRVLDEEADRHGR
jgi:RNA polymerase sigma-70 factor (ECF subfamily)